MIRLKLNLPEATVSYNETGALVGIPVEHTPNQIKNFSVPFEITGYITKHDFLAYSLYSPAQKFTVAEQISLLTSLGFKTVPYFENEAGQGNQLIMLKNQYSMYDAIWISLPSGAEFKIPELAHINSVKWKMGADRALTLECYTDKGVFDVVDMKLLAYYQPGCTAKVWNGALQPMNTAQIVEPIPPVCPKCNNPLKRIQIYPDLPLFYKCTSPICDQLVLDEDQDAVIEPEVDTADVQADFRDEATDESAAEPVSEGSVSDEAVTEENTTGTAETADVDSVTDTEVDAAVKQIKKCFVDTAKVDDADVEKLVAAGLIEVVDDIEEADCILVKTKLAVSKTVRNLSKEFDKELVPVIDFE